MEPHDTDAQYPQDLAEEQARTFATKSDRRSQHRQEVRLPVRYRYPGVRRSQWSYGIVLNLSETGGAFLVDGAWPYAERVDGADGFRIELEVTGLPDQRPLHLAGGVVWITPDGGGAEGIDRIGVKFTDLEDEELVRLRHVLREC